jgi:bisphosphoglycerate-independent phosphoglycerate mutase (AlkP superfamily)
MGIKGIPQSGTGQTAIFTGYNAPQIMGRHVAGFPPFSLRDYLKSKSLLNKFIEFGYKGSLVNAYSPRYFEMLEKHKRYERLMSASTLMQLGSGQKLLDLNDLSEGRAVYMDMTHWVLRKYEPWVAPRKAKVAGRILMDIARNYNLVIYEYFFPDKVGHDGGFVKAKKVISHMNDFLSGVWENIDPENELVIVCSDHGNFEDLSRADHTENPIPGIFYGCGEDLLSDLVKVLYDIPRTIYKLMNIEFNIV